MCCIYCMTSSFQNLLHSFRCLVTCDHVTWCDWCVTTWSGYPNHSSKNRKKDNLKRNENENENGKGVKNNLESTAFSFDTELTNRQRSGSFVQQFII